MKLTLFLILPLLLLTCRCGQVGPQEQSFDKLREMVKDKTAAEIECLLGPPDTRQDVLLGDERWIWWNYTFLDGNEYAPEVRGQVLHFEITFSNPSLPDSPRLPYSEWRIVSPHSVSYSGLTLSGKTVPSKQGSPGRGLSSESF